MSDSTSRLIGLWEIDAFRTHVGAAEPPEFNLGQPIRAILDYTGNPEGAPAIVIPPAWARTKETPNLRMPESISG